MLFTNLFSLQNPVFKEKELHLTNIAPYLQERKMQMHPLMAASTSFLPVRRMLFKLIAIFMTEMQSLFQETVPTLVELGFTAVALIYTKGLMHVLYLMG